MDLVISFLLFLLLIILTCSLIVPICIILVLIISPFLESIEDHIAEVDTKEEEGKVKTKEEDTGHV